jgi:protein-S-isoprenylcysteine O-methyltransferase Ste14
MQNSQLSRGDLMKMVVVRWVGATLFLVAIFFLPAGTWNYWQAWAYIVVMVVPAGFALAFLMKKDPALLERRMRTREREPQQRLIIGLSLVWFILVFLMPGFDRRFGWSNVPAWAVIAADVLIFVAYVFICRVFWENRYASRVVEVEQGQKVISSGPYALIRHPMYAGIIPMYLLTPLALGSYWVLIPALLIVPILVARIRNEEAVLVRELNGYAEYMQKVRYRLIPGMW